MPSLNHVQLEGRVAAPPEVMKPSPAGYRVTFVVATDRDSTSDGELKPVTDFHRVVARGPLAKMCAQELKVDALVRVVGSLVNRGFEKDGENRFITEIHANAVEHVEEDRTSEIRATGG
jgi:single-strand DNA-binding protein